MKVLPRKSLLNRLTGWPTPNLLALLAAVAILPYLNALFNGFVYDDLTQVLNNPYILSFHHLGQIFSTSVWSFTGKEGVTNYYRPLMTFGYLLCHKIFGDIAFGYHLVNVLLNAAVVCSIFGLTLALFQRRSLAFVTSVIFALHPVHTEPVAWIAGAPDLEVTLFMLLGFWFYHKGTRPQGGPSGTDQLGMAAFFMLALLSKEQALMLPVLAATWEHAYRGDRRLTSWKQKLARYELLWLVAAAYLLVRIRLLGALAPVSHSARLTWPQAFFSAFALTGHYVAKFFWPWRLCAFYVFHKSTSLLDPRALAGLLIFTGMAVAFAMLWRNAHAVSFGIIWFIVTLAPVLNARWMAANVFAERYLYLPSVGLCWILAWSALAIWQRVPAAQSNWRATLAAAAGVILLLSSVRIVVRNRDWKNGVRLYTRTLAMQPDADPILNNLGTLYWDEGKISQAEREWAMAYRLDPSEVAVLNNLGMYYAREGAFARAVSYFRRAMQLNPAYTGAHLNLGRVDEKRGRLHRAELQFRAAVALAPLNVGAHTQLAKLYVMEGSDSQAASQFRQSIRLKPSVEALDGLGKIDERQGLASQAGSAFESALQLNPFDSVAHFNLAALDAAAGRLDRAKKEYEAGLQTDPNDAAALAALGRLQRGETHQKR